MSALFRRAPKATAGLQFPDGAPTAEQVELAQYGVELFRALAVRAGVRDTVTPVAYAVSDGALMVVRPIRGGGRILVAPDRTVLYASSSLPDSIVLSEFESGRRTPIEKFPARH